MDSIDRPRSSFRGLFGPKADLTKTRESIQTQFDNCNQILKDQKRDASNSTPVFEHRAQLGDLLNRLDSHEVKQLSSQVDQIDGKGWRLFGLFRAKPKQPDVSTISSAIRKKYLELNSLPNQDLDENIQRNIARLNSLETRLENHSVSKFEKQVKHIEAQEENEAKKGTDFVFVLLDTKNSIDEQISFIKQRKEMNLVSTEDPHRLERLEALSGKLEAIQNKPQNKAILAHRNIIPSLTSSDLDTLNSQHFELTKLKSSLSRFLPQPHIRSEIENIDKELEGIEKKSTTAKTGTKVLMEAQTQTNTRQQNDSDEIVKENLIFETKKLLHNSNTYLSETTNKIRDNQMKPSQIQSELSRPIQQQIYRLEIQRAKINSEIKHRPLADQLSQQILKFKKLIGTDQAPVRDMTIINAMARARGQQ